MKKFWKVLGLGALVAGLTPYKVEKDEETGEKSYQALLWRITSAPSRGRPLFRGSSVPSRGALQSSEKNPIVPLRSSVYHSVYVFIIPDRPLFVNGPPAPARNVHITGDFLFWRIPS